MLEGKVPMPSLDVAQIITSPSTDNNLTKLQAKLAVEAITTFDKGCNK